ncbi:hypothetical protein GCM10023205_53830 [Yinghuangia aomiensis]|uniref:Uncharacterized protein n=1 Tax=Yinghuangia aomiensis TaxID=676205 RepID=A0ABP9HVE9_9ACTN
MLSVPELAALARQSGIDAGRFDGALAELARLGMVVVLEHRSPDPHLASIDLRTAAAVNPDLPDGPEHARRIAQEHWERRLRSFLAAHRCG